MVHKYFVLFPGFSITLPELVLVLVMEYLTADFLAKVVYEWWLETHVLVRINEYAIRKGWVK